MMTPIELQQFIRSSVQQLRARDDDLGAVVVEADRHGWDKVVAAMNEDQRLRVITGLLKNVAQKQSILESVCKIYDHLIEQLVAEAGHELQTMEMHMGFEVERAYAQARSSGTNWLALLAAGGAGYLLGSHKSKRDR